MENISTSLWAVLSRWLPKKYWNGRVDCGPLKNMEEKMIHTQTFQVNGSSDRYKSFNT